MRLNGWQRLWVVFSVLSLVALVWEGADNAPRTIYVHPLEVELLDSPIECDPKVVLRYSPQFTTDPRKNVYPQEVTAICREVTAIRQLYPGISGKDYLAKLRAINSQRLLEHWSSRGFAWLGFIILVYLAGYLGKAIVVWVIRGFKKQQ